MRYAFFVWSSDSKRSSNGFGSFFSPEGDAEFEKLQAKLVVDAWLTGAKAATARMNRIIRIIRLPDVERNAPLLAAAH
jgi:hypothetical protein